MSHSFVVTGGGRGIGRAITERLVAGGGVVVAVELDPAALSWVSGRVVPLAGDAADEAVARHAASLADEAAPLAGWVNNAALFRDVSLHDAPASEVLAAVTANLAPVVAGCAAAVRHWTAAGTPGAIVNLSSHQARQAVPGALPYATAKAAIEGLTRALAVEYGPRGIRCNAVAPGSVRTARYDEHLAAQPDGGAAGEDVMRRVHPLGRVADAAEIAAAVAWLLSDDASFVTGATVPVDGGRTVLAHDPEAR